MMGETAVKESHNRLIYYSMKLATNSEVNNVKRTVREKLYQGILVKQVFNSFFSSEVSTNST